MSFTKAKKHLEKYHLEKNIIEFEVSSATVKLAALALGCEEKEIAKTLAFIINDEPILIVTAGNQKIDNTKFKETFHAKAKMLDFNSVEEKIGHEVGGVCPFGIKESISVYLDESLKDFKTIYPACGSHNSAIKLTLEELELASNFKDWVNVCKTIE